MTVEIVDFPNKACDVPVRSVCNSHYWRVSRPDSVVTSPIFKGFNSCENGASLVPQDIAGGVNPRQRWSELQEALEGWGVGPGIRSGDWNMSIQWVDSRENLQETIDFPMKYGIFL